MKREKIWKQEYIVYIISIFVIFVAILPYFLSIIYVVPAADDFSFANNVRKYESSYWMSILSIVKEYYYGWQGVYLGVALSSGLNPIVKGNFVGLNFILCIFFLIWVVIWGYMLYKICINNDIYDKKITSLLIVLVIAACLNARVAKESFFWFVGACNYLLPLLIGIVGIICCINVSHQKTAFRKVCYIIGGGLAAFLASGGSPQIAGYCCWIYLLLVCWNFMKKKNKAGGIIVFISGLLGALINVCAPGNFARQDASYAQVSVFKAGYYTIISVINELEYLFSSTYLPWVFLIIVIIGFLYLKPIKEKVYHPIIVMSAVIISWLISTFPVCYGYADSTLSERCYEMLDFFIIIGLFLIINSMINWIKQKPFLISRETLYLVGILAVINIGYLQSIVPINSMPSIQCWKQLLSGELKAYHEEWIETFNTIKESEELVVEVPISKWAYESELVIMRPGMSENSVKWVNKAVATFYEKEEVYLLINEE